jgi:hypothetical protein
VPLTNNRVIAYTAPGKPIAGWNPRTVEEKLIEPLRPFRLNGRDYLYSTGDKGSLFVFNLRGERQTISQTAIAGNGTSFHLRATESAFSEWIVSDTGSRVRFFTIDTLWQYAETSTVQEAMPTGYVVWPEREEGIYLTGDRYMWAITDSRFKKKYVHNLTDTVSSPPFFTSLSNGTQMIGWTDATASQLHLFTTDGSEYPTFPVAGATVFTIGNMMSDGKNYLVGGDGHKQLRLLRLK